MNIEKAIDILKNSIADYVIGEYCEKCADNKICDDRNEDCYYQQAIDMVLTAYEKEKEKNKRLEKFIENGEHTWKQKYNETFKYVEDEFVSKDKIRLKMKQEMDKGYRLSEERHLQNYAYDRLKELLEE